jgi:hypothetical protein
VRAPNASSRTCATQMGNGLRTMCACVLKRTSAHRQCGSLNKLAFQTQEPERLIRPVYVSNV